MIPFLFWSFILPSLLVFCVNASKGSQKSKKDISKKLPIVSAPTVSNSGISSESEEKSKSERSSRSLRNSVNDSLKVPRSNGIASSNMSNSGKSSRKSASSKSQKGTGGSDTDSAKTETIEVPLGKAEKDCAESSILTPAEEQKTTSYSAQTQKVTFAQSLKRVKARGVKRENPEDEKTLYIPN